MSESVSRKSFVALVGTATAVTTLASAPPAADAATKPTHRAAPAAEPHPAHAAKNAAPPLTFEPEAYIFFTSPEAHFVEAAVERLIPTDANGPGAKDAGVAYFIDQQLNGVFGNAGNSYRAGPWGNGTPQQGYQLRQTPAELYRQSIAAIDAYCATTYRKPFAQLSVTQQDAVLTGIDGESISSPDAPLKPFFDLLLQNTIEGFFADPMYGGNRDKVGWKLVGFPGVAAYYAVTIAQWNKPYHVAPVSVADVQHGAAVVAQNPQLVEHLSRMGEMREMRKP